MFSLPETEKTAKESKKNIFRFSDNLKKVLAASLGVIFCVVLLFFIVKSRPSFDSKVSNNISESTTLSIPTGTIFFIKKGNEKELGKQELWKIIFDKEDTSVVLISKNFNNNGEFKTSIPRFSFDYEKVLFLSKNKSIYTKKIADENEYEMIFESETLKVFDPSFGFNCDKKIVFVGENVSEGKQIYEYDFINENEKKLRKISNFDKTILAIKDPIYFSNGEKIICFVKKNKDTCKFLIINSETGDILKEIKADITIAWSLKSFELSPDESKIVYSTNKNTHILNIEGDDSKDTVYPIYLSQLKIWSPDNKFIVFDAVYLMSILDLSPSSKSPTNFIFEGNEVVNGYPVAWKE